MQNKDIDMLQGVKVAVLGGGVSSEREISLISAEQAHKALVRKNIDAVLIDITSSDKEKVKAALMPSNVDLAFIALHGEFGEDGKIQAILEELGLPYTGSDSLASYLAMDKIESKKIFRQKGIPTADFAVLEKNDQIDKNYFKQKYPLVVKPYFSGSSVGVSIVRSEEELLRAIDEAFALQSKVLIEDYIKGREFTVGILENRPLAVVEIVVKSEYFDFVTKYSDGMAEFIAPAKLDKAVYEKIQNLAIAAHSVLGCRYFSRVDLRLDEKSGIPYVLEVNSIPGLTTHSLLPLSASCCGIGFDELILRMAYLALDGQKHFKEARKN